MNRISKIRSRMLLKQPFFGTILMAYPLVETDAVPTAATDMQKIYYNPSFFATLTDGQVTFALAHEVMHIAFKHGLRIQNRIHKPWNFATDYAMNPMLVEAGFEFIPGVLYEKVYAGSGAEKIYDQLVQEMEPEPEPQQAPGDGEPDGDQSSGGDSGDEVGGQGDKPQPGGNGPPLSDDVMRPADMSPAEQAQLDARISQQVAQAATMARMAGKMPASLERAITEILSPAAPIEEILRQYMTETERNDESWSRRNRRFTSVYMPARHNEAMGEVVMIGDTSGSVTQRDLGLIAGMVTRVSENMHPERVRMVWATTKVEGEQVFEQGDPLDFKPVGFGGTDMRVPLEHVEQFDPTVVVLVTDGYTPWPDEEPPYPLIVCCTTDTPVPVGQVVRI